MTQVGPRTAIPKSGHHYSSHIVRSYLLGLEEVMGSHGVRAILTLAGLTSWAQSLPADGIDFAEFSALQGALEELYGSRGGRALARRCAWVAFDDAIRPDLRTEPMGVSEMAARPQAERLRLGLEAVARLELEISDQRFAVREAESSFLCALIPCGACWGRQSTTPACAAALGFLEQSLRVISGGLVFPVREIRCRALGAPACVFDVAKQPTD